MSEKIQIPGDLERLEIRPGEKLAVSVPDNIFANARDVIEKAFSNWAGDVPVIVYPASYNLTVVAKQEGGDAQDMHGEV